ncbi:hypothetical protein U1Q18_034097 [Sarracenia purpurea var. burkii]
MPVKRSRIGRSSSFGDTGVLSPTVESAGGWIERRPASSSTTAAKPQSNSAMAKKPSGAEKSVESPPRILTLSSPTQESVDASGKEPIGQFLDKCYYCKEKIRDNTEVFMYSYLRAFCTAECRDRQIVLDNVVEKASGKSKGMQVGPTG